MKLFLNILFLFILSCQSTSIKNNNKNDITSGWQDVDTYTVRVVAESEIMAIDKAKHMILKDIVNVRVLNDSKYTDITKIKDEFEGPLEKGKVLKKRRLPHGLEIYFQIWDKDLKKKFERK